MCTRRSTLPLVVAAVLIACWAKAALGQSSVTIPASSVSRPYDAGVRVHTNVQIMALPATSHGNAVPDGGGYFFETPASLACLYGLTQPKDSGCNPNDSALSNPSGGSGAIAVVDAYDNPNAASDLAAFSLQFGLLAPAKFSVIYAPAGAQPGTGQCKPGLGSQPQQDPAGGWEFEESLDVQYAHSMAPQATLYLVEAQSDSNIDMYCAVSVASNLVAEAGGGEVSMSFGSGEFLGETSVDLLFTANKVVYFASSGDSPGVMYPAASPNVVSVGGTSTSRNPLSGSFLGETNWQSAGGGTSAFEPRPTYQNQILSIVGNHRGTPDMALDSNPYTGVWVLDNFVALESGANSCGGSVPCWLIAGGTSVASPTLAGIVNAAGNFSPSSAAELTTLYGAPGGAFNSIKAGSCGPYMGYSVTSSWNFCTGLGSPDGYVSSPPVAPPAFNPGAGTYNSAQNVIISTATAGASIRYTTDGSTPSETAGTLYSGPITVSSSMTIKAIAYSTSMPDSAVVSAAYTLNLISASNSAQFVKTDTATEGTWTGVYGASGYNVIDGTVSYPGNVTVTPGNQLSWIWASSTTDVRALQLAPLSTSRIAATWYTPSSSNIDLVFSDTEQHQLAIYSVDFDHSSRTQTISILDGTTSAVLDSRSLAKFDIGEWLVWTVSGHVIVRVTNTGPVNAVISGLFFN